MALRLSPIAVALTLAACGSGVHATTAAAACDRVAARNGSDRQAGTVARPFKTAQRLADALRPGQTGCLRAGTYEEMTDGGYVLKFFRGGRPGAPITVQSYPGERAELKGVVYFPKQSPHVTLRRVDIDGRARWLEGDVVTVQLMAKDITFEDNRLTNHGLKSCMIMGSNSGWGRAVGAVVRGSEFAGCGNPDNGMLDHGIYVQNAVRTTISDNVFTGVPGYAVHLYPNARRTRVLRNVMVGNGGGVIFAGEGRWASSRNLVARNVIADTRSDYAIAYSWGSRVGRANVARDNCISGTGIGAGVEDPLGFKARGNADLAPRFLDGYTLAPGSSCARVVGSVSAGLVR